MKTTNTSRLLAITLMMIASIVPFINAGTALIVLAGITLAILTQAVVTRMEDGKNLFRTLGVIIALIASATANLLFHEDRALIYTLSYFMTSLFSLIFYFLPAEHSKEKERLGRTVDLQKMPQRETIRKGHTAKVPERVHVISV